MKANITKCLFIVGIVLFVIGFYAMFFKAGLPYPDPTPEMTRKWMFYNNFGKLTMPLGVILVILGFALKLFGRLTKK